MITTNIQISGQQGMQPSVKIFCLTYTKIGTIQIRLTWPLRKDDTQNHEASLHILQQVMRFYMNLSLCYHKIYLNWDTAGYYYWETLCSEIM